MGVWECWDTAKGTDTCFVYFNASHLATGCWKRIKRTKDGCKGTHPRYCTEMKWETSATKGQKGVFTVSRQPVGSTRLGVVPVNVVTLKWTSRVLDFMDRGSNTVLVTDNFIRRVDIPKRLTKLTINTVGSVRETKLAKVHLWLRSIEDGESMDIHEAFAIDKLPVRPPDPIGAMVWKWSHLRDVSFAEMAGHQWIYSWDAMYPKQ